MLALAASAALPLAVALHDRRTRPLLLRWRGIALGAEAKLLLAHEDRDRAARVLFAVLDEVRRLERVFSLFDPASELRRLNADGRLAAPSHDLRVVLSAALRVSALSGGAFDPTVQPLWSLYARHFAAPSADPAGPGAQAVDRARALVGHGAVDTGRRGIRLARPGMALTLNGIAQGYIADRVADVLRGSGFGQALVQVGEVRAIGGAPDGEPWRVRPQLAGATLPRAATPALVDGALAVSAADGMAFDEARRHHHLLDPATGGSSRRQRAVAVVAETAMAADALSTALAVLPTGAAQGLLRAGGGRRALVVSVDGALRVVEA